SAGRALVAAGGRGGGEQALHRPQGPRRGAERALPHARRHARDHQGRHPLRLVAGHYARRCRSKLISRIRYHAGRACLNRSRALAPASGWTRQALRLDGWPLEQPGRASPAIADPETRLCQGATAADPSYRIRLISLERHRRAEWPATNRSGWRAWWSRGWAGAWGSARPA